MSNILTRTLTFFHDRQRLSAEVEYIVDINPDKDGAKCIGEITNEQGEVFEVKDRVVCAEFHAANWQLVEDARMELVLERSSRLRDFNTDGYHFGTKEPEVI